LGCPPILVADSCMSVSFETRVEEARKKEAFISFELYRLLRNTILVGLTYQESKCTFKEVIPEFPVDGERADLAVFASRYDRAVEPFSVIEVKVRALDRPGPSMASAVKRALAYARKLSRTGIFFVAYDGWTLLAFRDVPSYLVKACGTIADQNEAGDLLKGLEEYSYRNKSDSLNSLPRHPDTEFLLKRILPSVAKVFAKNPQEVEQLLGSWKRIL